MLLPLILMRRGKCLAKFRQNGQMVYGVAVSVKAGK
jgi:hypothetical protein